MAICKADAKDVGMKRGKGYAVNVPLRDGIRDDSYHSIFKPVSGLYQFTEQS